MKNIEEYVETNRTLNDVKYDQHLLEVNLKLDEMGVREREDLEQEIRTKEMIKQELKESLEINLK